ncbi:hypothetical protein VTO73DRAFT_12939 [Trametes versicolor]
MARWYSIWTFDPMASARSGHAILPAAQQVIAAHRRSRNLQVPALAASPSRFKFAAALFARARLRHAFHLANPKVCAAAPPRKRSRSRLLPARASSDSAAPVCPRAPPSTGDRVRLPSRAGSRNHVGCGAPSRSDASARSEYVWDAEANMSKRLQARSGMAGCARRGRTGPRQVSERAEW